MRNLFTTDPILKKKISTIKYMFMMIFISLVLFGIKFRTERCVTHLHFKYFFNIFLTFFQIPSRTWGINFDTIACVFELVDGQKKCLIFSTFFSKKTYFWGPTYQFFSCGHLDYVHNEQFWGQNFLKFWSSGVTWWIFLFL